MVLSSLQKNARLENSIKGNAQIRPAIKVREEDLPIINILIEIRDELRKMNQSRR